MNTSRKIKVAYYERRPRPEGNFSIETIFADLRERLADHIDAVVHKSSTFNDGMLSKFSNITEAASRVGDEQVCHVTGEVHFLDLLLPRKKVVLTIHDCRFMERKAGNPLTQRLMKWLYLDGPIARAAIVTTVSETTKSDIIRYTACPADKIEVIPVAVNTGFTPARRPFNTDRPRVLHIGTKKNKNLERLIEAVSPLNCTLVIVGQLTGPQTELLSERRVDYETHVNLSQEAMIDLYRGCDVLSFVSTFEGFGMPIVEANLVERPVLTSNCSSMPEVAADSALLVDPYSVDEIRRGLRRLFSEPELRSRLIEAGRKNRLRFTPELVAERYLNCYRRIAGLHS